MNPNPIRPEHGSPEEIDAALKVGTVAVSLAGRPDLNVVAKALEANFTPESLNAWKRLRGVDEPCSCTVCCVAQYLVRNGHAECREVTEEESARFADRVLREMIAAVIAGRVQDRKWSNN